MKHFGSQRSSSPLQYQSHPVGPTWELRTGGVSWRPHRGAAMRCPPSFVQQSFASSVNTFANPDVSLNRSLSRRSTPLDSKAPGSPRSQVRTPPGYSFSDQNSLSPRSRLSVEELFDTSKQSQLSVSSRQTRASTSPSSTRAWVAQRGQLSHKELMNGLCCGSAPNRQDVLPGGITQGPWNNRFIHGSPVFDRNSRWPNASKGFADNQHVPPERVFMSFPEL